MELRELMPVTAKRIDQMREKLGKDAVNSILRKAMAGESGHFFAMENHRTFGTPDTTVTSSMCWDESDRCYRVEPGWMVDAATFALTMGIEVEIKDMQDFEEARDRARALRKILREARYDA
jgi:hypothetical protein